MQCGQDYADFLVEFADLSSSLQPVNSRHHEVHDNDVWMKAGGQRHCGAAILKLLRKLSTARQFPECCGEEFSPQGGHPR
jgi:hypothetical protein